MSEQNTHHYRKTTNAPRALVLGTIISNPPTTSAIPISGISHSISNRATLSLIKAVGKFSEQACSSKLIQATID
jgi:hypothetical protein